MSDYKEYIITVKKFEFLDSLYKELETNGLCPQGTDIVRQVECVHKKPTSRSTHYMLTDEEAIQLKNDSRILVIEPAPQYRGLTPQLFLDQSSNFWNKSLDIDSYMKNWGLFRCTSENQLNEWGANGQIRNSSGTVVLSQIGRNVDVVIVDGGHVLGNHPEFSTNSDGSGSSRFVPLNWYQYNPEVKNTATSTYSYVDIIQHATHVAGTTVGNTQGWAKGANLYSIYWSAGSPENATLDESISYVIDYVRAFHRNKNVNSNTGRKNPTIVNNSWGVSVGANVWNYDDITAVTYRGTRYTAPSLGGYSGICTSYKKIGNLVNLQNGGNRIITSGINQAIDWVLSKPASWILEWIKESQKAYKISFSQPIEVAELTIQGPASIEIIHNPSAFADAGTVTMSASVEIILNDEVIKTYGAGPVSNISTEIIALDINTTFIENSYINLPENDVYTVRFNNNISTTEGSIVTFADVSSVQVYKDYPSSTVTSITAQLLGPASLTASTSPNLGNNNNGAWTINLPFNIEFIGKSYGTVYVGTNHYITFGDYSTVGTYINENYPEIPKILWSSGNNSVQRIYYGTEGTSPNRKFRIRTEGHSSFSGGVLGNPTMVCEYVFYENTPNQIDLQCGVNSKTGFSREQLTSWGLIEGQNIPARVASIDADLEDAYNEGIVMVGAAGNSNWRHCLPEDSDWDNTFEMAARYPTTVLFPLPYMQGSSPTANDNAVNGIFDLPAICVGSVDMLKVDQKAVYSDCGSGVDIWAPGTGIISANNDSYGVYDPRNTNFTIIKLQGTSMASPQVAGVLACALEMYPHWTQRQSKEYLTNIAKQNQLLISNGGPGDVRDLQGAPNLLLFYKLERPLTGVAFPKITAGYRPTTGALYPRNKIIYGR